MLGGWAPLLTFAVGCVLLVAGSVIADWSTSPRTGYPPVEMDRWCRVALFLFLAGVAVVALSLVELVGAAEGV